MINTFISSPNETEREIIRLNMSKIETYKIEEVSNMINPNLITYQSPMWEKYVLMRELRESY